MNKNGSYQKQPELTAGQPRSAVTLEAACQIAGATREEACRDVTLTTCENPEVMNLINRLAEVVVSQEQRLKDLQVELDHLHEEKNQAYLRLANAEKMAALGNLIAGVAHEINNPANFISGGAVNLEKRLKHFKGFLFDLLDEEGEGEAIRDAFESRFEPIFNNLGTVVRGARRISSVVTELRYFSRQNNAEMTLEDVVPGIKATVHLVQTNYREKVNFECNYTAAPKIQCRLEQLNQVFMNLLINACQAIAKKQQEQEDFEGQVTITTTIEGSSLVISFLDNGRGIPEEHMEKIFEPFFTTKEVGVGTGLGLPLSKGIVEQHNGKLTVTTQEGLGSDFRVHLPIP